MQISDFVSLLGGLALFLYGMQMMSAGLEAAAGAKMQMILQRLTSNRFLGVLVGAAITAVIQSSSATTVMVVGFVNSRMMTLNQAVWIIMGANIGTTMTAQLLTLDINTLAPLIAFVGVGLAIFVKKPRVQHVGQILAGLGVLFIGMGMMSAAMLPLRESQRFAEMMSNFSNPVLGILAGLVVTAIIQSSSASVGILQALASSGVITLGNAVYVLFGQNIGTCVTAVLAAIGTSRNAKRTTVIHLLFNVFGTILFTFLCVATPLTALVESFAPDNVKAQIANMHTLFNVATTLILLPFGAYLAKLATRILPERPEEHEDEMHLEYLAPITASPRDGGLGFSAIYLEQLRRELERMTHMARDNVLLSFQAVINRKDSLIEQVEQKEEYIDFLNKEISYHISRLIAAEANEGSSTTISSYFTITGNVERIGDHAMNICGYSRLLVERKIQFSTQAMEELKQMRNLVLEGIDALLQTKPGDLEGLTEMSALEQKNDDMTATFRHNHLERMRSGVCTDEACIIYAELLTDFERLGDHILNIAEEMAQMDR